MNTDSMNETQSGQRFKKTSPIRQNARSSAAYPAPRARNARTAQGSSRPVRVWTRMYPITTPNQRSLTTTDSAESSHRYRSVIVEVISLLKSCGDRGEVVSFEQ